MMNNKTVLLYSGGMDSMCAAYLHPYDVLLRVPSGSGYDGPEATACERLAGLHNRWSKVVTLARMFDFSLIERQDHIVPNRNAHLVLAASLYGLTIHLAAVDGDRSADKDAYFCQCMELLLNHMWQKQHWTEERTFSVTLPFAYLSKAQLLQAALDAGMPHTALYLSYSCYGGKDKACGVCKPCVRKYVAMATCRIHVPAFTFARAAEQAEWLPEALNDCATRGWRSEAEDRDFLRVFA